LRESGKPVEGAVEHTASIRDIVDYCDSSFLYHHLLFESTRLFFPVQLLTPYWVGFFVHSIVCDLMPIVDALPVWLQPNLIYGLLNKNWVQK